MSHHKNDLKEVRLLRIQLGIGDAEWQRRLKRKYDVSNIDALSDADMGDLLKRLRALNTKRKDAAAAKTARQVAATDRMLDDLQPPKDPRIPEGGFRRWLAERGKSLP